MTFYINFETRQPLLSKWTWTSLPERPFAGNKESNRLAGIQNLEDCLKGNEEGGCRLWDIWCGDVSTFWAVRGEGDLLTPYATSCAGFRYQSFTFPPLT